MERTILTRGLLVAVLLASCLKASNGYHCATDSQCSTGTCEVTTGFCSFVDASCQTGRRYGAEAGSLSSTCVGQMADASVDMPVAVDAAIDGIPIDGTPVMPVVAAFSTSNTSGTATLSYSLDVPSGPNRFLIVSVHLGTQCGATVPGITSVAFNGVALTQVDSLVGTSCVGDVYTRSDQWQLVSPPAGSHLVVVTLDAVTTYTIHSGAISFEGVNQIAPIRATAKLASNGTSSYVEVASAPGDLVIDTAATGGAFTGPDASQTQVFLNNTNGGNTLNNNAASTKPGAVGLVAFIWNGNNDVWHDIASSLRPAP
jgi:hypothetical protein